ncbi:MAG: hypothetical protein KGJ86_20820, partial [Chloroflexota bacterium]|nr:hypothetical protein [Chloroflexota bacterium]
MDVSAIPPLTAEQTAKLAEFGASLHQSAIEALGTTLDKKLEVTSITVSPLAPEAVPAEFVGLFLTAQVELRLSSGSTAGALVFLGEDEASMLFNVSPADAANEEDYTAKLEEAVHTSLSDLSDFLTLSVSVNSGAQMQFGIGEVHLLNLAQNPLELPPNRASGDVLLARLELVAEDTPPMVVSYLMSTNDLPAVL